MNLFNPNFAGGRERETVAFRFQSLGSGKQFAMKRRHAEQSEAHGKGTAVCAGEGALEFTADRRQSVIEGGGFGKVHVEASPSQHVDRNKPNLLNLVALDGYEHEAAFARFVDVAALKIPWKDDRRALAELALRMDVPEGPVVISFGYEILDTAWGVDRMNAGVVARRMKETDVEEIGPCWRIVLRQILGDGAVWKALAVDCNAKVFDHMRFRPPAREFEGILRPSQPSAHLVRRIMIPANHGDLYVSLVESSEAGYEIQTGFVVTPVAVENVAGDHNEIDPFVDCELDHFPKCAQCGAGDIFCSTAGAFAQPGQWTIEMKVSSVNESHECPRVK